MNYPIKKGRYTLVKNTPCERIFVMRSELDGFADVLYEFHYHFNHKDRNELGKVYPTTRINKIANRLRQPVTFSIRMPVKDLEWFCK